MRTKTFGSLLVLTAGISCMSCAASVAGGTLDARDATLAEASVDASSLDAVEFNDADNAEVFDANGPSIDTLPERDGASGEVSMPDGATFSDSREDAAPTVADAALDAIVSADTGRECEDFNGRGICPLLYETSSNDPGAVFVCCNGRCVSGPSCASTPGLGRCTVGARDPRGCNIAIGELCCEQYLNNNRCVQRDTGRCRRLR